MKSDEELIEEIKRGDDDAWAELYDRYFEAIVRFCSNYVKSLGEAEDLSQDVFIKIRDKAATFKSGARFRPWLYQVSRNHSLDHLKKHGKKMPAGTWSKSYYYSSTRIHIVDKRPSPATDLVEKDFMEDLYRKLDQLEEEERTAVLLKYHEEMSREEIAEAMNLTLRNVKARLYTALKKLKESVKK